MLQQRRRILQAGLGVLLGRAAWAEGADSDTAKKEIRLRFSIAVQNKGETQAEGERLTVFLPLKSTATQDFISCKVNAASSIGSDRNQSTICDIEVAPLPPYATRIYAFECLVAVHELPRPQELIEPVALLAPQNFIESEAVAIVELSKRLRRSEQPATVGAIYDWVRSNISYAGFTADDRGALAALQERRGDCTEYAYLVAALCRASGIPARVLGGYLADHDAVLHAKGYHNWVEVYFDGAWQIVDAQLQRLYQNPGRYIGFKIIDGGTSSERFSVSGALSATMS